MSAPATPGKAFNSYHSSRTASPPSTSAASSSQQLHHQNHLVRSASNSSSVHSQLQNLHLNHVSSSSLASASSAPDMLEDDDSGDISMSIPRSRSDRLLANNLQRSISRPSSTSPSLTPSTSRTPAPSNLSRTAWPSTAPLPANGDPHPLQSAVASSPAPFHLTTKGTAAFGNEAPNNNGTERTPALKVSEGSSSPIPSVVTTAPPDQLLSPTKSFSHSHSQVNLAVHIPSANVPQRLGASTAGGSRNVDPVGDGTHSSPRPPALVDANTARQMGRWVKEIVVCNFDLERGPVVERRAVGRRWGPGLKENVAFSSFPDTSLFTEGSIQFSFKVRDVLPEPESLAYPEPPSPLPDRNGAVLQHSRGHSLSREKEAEYRVWDERGREWLYGYVFFHQKKDKSISRGFMQKSVVILTHLPLPALFHEVLKRLAPAFFEHGYTAIEVACHSIAGWPDPEPDSVLEVPLMTDILTFKLPDETENPQVALPGRGPQPILASLPASTPLRSFATFLPALWSIWECLVLAEPLLIIAPDPKTCSEVVWWLRELVRPLPLAGDFRPYLHIHDHDFSLLVNASKPQAGVVVGVTNPFFRNAASHWPNVISIPGASKPKLPGKQDVPEGFVSRRARSISKDRPLLKRLEALVAAGRLDDPDGNAALRMHFQQLTDRLLVPLNRYFQTLVPPRSPMASTPQTPSPSHPQLQLHQQLHHPRPQRGSPLVTSNGHLTPVIPPSPALGLQTLKPFALPTFLQHLRTHGPNPLAFKARGISSKSRVESDFYASFCKSSMFSGWLSARVESLGTAVASNMLEDALAAAAAMRASPDPFAAERHSQRSSTEASATTASSAATSLSPSSDNEMDEAETPRPNRENDDPLTHSRLTATRHRPDTTLTPTRLRPASHLAPRRSSLSP